MRTLSIASTLLFVPFLVHAQSDWWNYPNSGLPPTNAAAADGSTLSPSMSGSGSTGGTSDMTGFSGAQNTPEGGPSAVQTPSGGGVSGAQSLPTSALPIESPSVSGDVTSASSLSPVSASPSSAASGELSSRSGGTGGTGVRMTYYDAGLGACGETNSDSDMIVALSTLNWDNGAHCNKKITITYNGKTESAAIMDRCMGCPSAGLDLTPTLFAALAPTSVGHFQGDWSYAE